MLIFLLMDTRLSSIMDISFLLLFDKLIYCGCMSTDRYYLYNNSYPRLLEFFYFPSELILNNRTQKSSSTVKISFPKSPDSIHAYFPTLIPSYGVTLPSLHFISNISPPSKLAKIIAFSLTKHRFYINYPLV